MLQRRPRTATLTQHHEGSHSESRDEVPPLVVVGAGSRPLHRRAHAVLVVLADEDAGQLPQSRHVEGLKDLALQGGGQQTCLPFGHKAYKKTTKNVFFFTRQIS